MLHLETDSGIVTTGSDVTSWSDASAAANDVTAVGAPQLLVGELNGRDVVRFDGLDDRLGRTTGVMLPAGNADRSVFVVARYFDNQFGAVTYGTSSCNQAFGLGTAGDGNLKVQGWCTDHEIITDEPGAGAGWMIHGAIHGAGVISQYRDGFLVDSRAQNFATVVGQLSLGWELDSTIYAEVDVAAVLIYDRALTPTERTDVENYLREKYFGVACGANLVPEARNDVAAAAVGGAVAIPVLANDADLDGSLDPTSVTIVTMPTRGSVGVDAATGVVTYTHGGGADFVDSFTYQVSDTLAGVSNIATVDVSVGSTSCPLVVDGLVLALESGTGVLTSGSQVTGWEDQSVHGNDVVAAGDPELVLNVLNGQPAIHFDGNSDLLERTLPLSGFPAGNDRRSMFVVVNYQSTGFGGVAYGNNSCNQAFGLSVNSAGELIVTRWCNDLDTPFQGTGAGWLIQSAIHQFGDVDHFLNGAQIDSSGNDFNTVVDRLTIGAELDGNPTMVMDVAAVLLYDRALTLEEHDQVVTYIQDKYFGSACPNGNVPVADDDFARVTQSGSVQINVLDGDIDNGTLDPASVTITSAPTRGNVAVDPVTGVVTYTHTDASLIADRFSYTVNDDTATTSNEAHVWVSIDLAGCELVTNGLVFHVEAGVGTDVVGSTVAHWYDQSGLGNDLESGGDPSVLSGNLNGHDVIEFDGAGDFLQRSGTFSGLPSGSADRTVIALVKYDGVGFGGIAYGTRACNQAFGLVVDADGDLTLQGWCSANDFPTNVLATGTGWLLHKVVLDGNSFTHFRDSSVIGTGNHVFNTANSLLTIGGELDGNPSVDMDVAEILIYDRALNTTECAIVEGYLRAKYFGLPCSGDGPPVADNEFERVVQGQSKAIDVLAGDMDGGMIDPTTVAIVTPPTRGNVSVDPVTGVVTYSHTAADLVADFFTYTVQDDAGLTSNAATVSIAIDHPGCGLVTNGLVLHVEAGVGVDLGAGTNVVGWADQSGMGNDLVTDGGPTLVSASINGHAAISLDGNDDKIERILALNGFPVGNADRSMFAVVRYNGTGPGGVGYGTPSCNQAFSLITLPNGDLMLAGWCGSSSFDSNVAGTGTGWFSHSAVLANDSFVHYKDGVSIDAQTHVFNTTMGVLVIGSEVNFGPFVDMDVAEILIYDRAVSELERQEIEDYFQTKYFNNPCPVPCNAPAITSNPTGVSLCEGGAVTLTATASGTGPLSYQWRKDGVDLVGANSSSFLLDPVIPSDAGSYDVVVSNACGMATSAAAVVDVLALPAITANPAAQDVCPGSPVSLAVSATGAAPLSYQWRKDGVDLAGETAATLMIASVGAGDAGSYDVVVTNGCGSTASAAASITLRTAPMIDVNPVSQSVCAGGSVTLTTAASGSAPLSYQWRKDGVDLVGETAASLLISPVTLADVGSYELVVMNDCGSATSAPAVLGVDEAPQITQQPAPQSACEGDSVMLSVTATGTLPLYQWRKDGVDLAGQTAATLNLMNVTLGDAGSYDVVVSNVCGSVTSLAVTVDVSSAPQITADPQGVAACAGTSAQFTVSATGSAPLSYQWRKDGVDVPGATTDSLQIAVVDTTDAGAYSVVVSNPCGSVTSAAAILDVLEAPSITAQPSAQTVCAGTAFTLSVSATGSNPLTYQWRLDGVDLPGATAASYSVGSAMLSDGGSYEVVVTNGCGSTTSVPAVITINTAPTVTQDPLASTVCAGDQATFTVVATGSAPLTYQWRRDGVNIPGANGPSLTVDPASVGDAGAYDITVMNSCGMVTSASASLTVEVAPTIVTPPASATLCEGSALNLTVSALGSAPLAYQWYRDGVAIAGATSDSYAVASATTTDAGSYTVDVSNSCGLVTSASAVVMVEFAPVVTQGPQSVTLCEGGMATFSVTATGSAPLTYQWRRDGVNLPGANGASLTIDPASVGDAGSYDITVMNSCGMVTSASASLTVEVAPVVLTSPADTTLCPGDSLVLTVSASGAAPLSYVWSKDGIAIAGATTATLTIPSVLAADAGSYQVEVANGCGSATSAAALVTILEAPQISGQPAAQSVCEADAVSFTVVASGSGPLSYQWRRNGVDLPGAATATLTIDPALAGDAGDYDVVVSNACGSVTSTVAALSILAGPAVVTQPQDASLCEGGNTTFTVAASGANPLSYQWRKDGVAISGATNASYTIAGVTGSDAGAYDVEITNSCGAVTSMAATLTVLLEPTISTQPLGGAACEGGSFVLSVVASGSPVPTYQWRKDGVDLVGATGSSLTIQPLQLADAGSYDVVVMNSCGATTSTAATLDVLTLPSITSQPVDLSVCPGFAAMFTVTATGSGPLGYQWRKDGIEIPGATTATLDFAAVTPSEAGSYDVVVANSCGMIASAPAVLSVLEVPAISAQPSDQSVCLGDSVTFTVSASGSGPLSYQWRKDGVDLAGANADSLTINPVLAADVGAYDVVVTNSCDTVVSNAAQLNVLDTPQITAAPTGGTVCEAGIFTLDVVATGSAPLAYQWRRDGVLLPGATSSSLVLDPVTLVDAGDYDVIVSNACGSVSSVVVTLTVDALPAITADPISQSVCDGDPVTFMVMATGAGPLSYQWRKDGVDLAGAQSASLTIDPVGTTELGLYDVVVTNACGSTVSAAALLEHLPPASCGIVFVRGNVNQDASVNLLDAVNLLNYLFIPGSAEPLCHDAADCNDDGGLNLLDPVVLLMYLFVPGSAPPAAPGPMTCGLDPTPDNLPTCVWTAPCP